jgi:hypothetical protein
MTEEADSTTFFRILFVCIGSYLIGSEYSTALGWGVWFIAMSMN